MKKTNFTIMLVLFSNYLLDGAEAALSTTAQQAKSSPFEKVVQLIQSGFDENKSADVMRGFIGLTRQITTGLVSAEAVDLILPLIEKGIVQKGIVQINNQIKMYAILALRALIEQNFIQKNLLGQIWPLLTQAVEKPDKQVKKQLLTTLNFLIDRIWIKKRNERPSSLDVENILFLFVTCIKEGEITDQVKAFNFLQIIIKNNLLNMYQDAHVLNIAKQGSMILDSEVKKHALLTLDTLIQEQFLSTSFNEQVLLIIQQNVDENVDVEIRIIAFQLLNTLLSCNNTSWDMSEQIKQDLLSLVDKGTRDSNIKVRKASIAALILLIESGLVQRSHSALIWKNLVQFTQRRDSTVMLEVLKVFDAALDAKIFDSSCAEKILPFVQESIYDADFHVRNLAYGVLQSLIDENFLDSSYKDRVIAMINQGRKDSILISEMYEVLILLIEKEWFNSADVGLLLSFIEHDINGALLPGSTWLMLIALIDNKLLSSTYIDQVLVLIEQSKNTDNFLSELSALQYLALKIRLRHSQVDLALSIVEHGIKSENIDLITPSVGILRALIYKNSIMSPDVNRLLKMLNKNSRVSISLIGTIYDIFLDLEHKKLIQTVQNIQLIREFINKQQSEYEDDVNIKNKAKEILNVLEICKKQIEFGDAFKADLA